MDDLKIIVSIAGLLVLVGGHIGSALWFLSKWSTMVKVLDDRLNMVSNTMEKEIRSLSDDIHDELEGVRRDIKELFGKHESVVRVEARLDDVVRRIGALEEAK